MCLPHLVEVGLATHTVDAVELPQSALAFVEEFLNRDGGETKGIAPCGCCVKETIQQRFQVCWGDNFQNNMLHKECICP